MDVGLAPSAAALRAMGRVLGATAPDGAVLLLTGPLGAGKTTLAKGVAEGCGVEGPVTSPTYNLVLHYSGRRPFTHVDLYRLGGPADLATLDLDEILDAPGVTCVEWPSLVAGLVAPPSASVEITVAPDQTRSVMLECEGDGWSQARTALGSATRT